MIPINNLHLKVKSHCESKLDLYKKMFNEFFRKSQSKHVSFDGSINLNNNNSSIIHNSSSSSSSTPQQYSTHDLRQKKYRRTTTTSNDNNNRKLNQISLFFLHEDIFLLKKILLLMIHQINKVQLHHIYLMIVKFYILKQLLK
jgi:hypothetical protein